jgi:hypothetical protein
VFLGDALADPLTGLAAACAALEGYAGGGGTLVDVNLRGVAAWVAAARPLHASECGTVRSSNGQWQLTTPDGEVRVAEPGARLAARPAAAFGADTVSVLREWTSARGNQPNSTNRQRTA